MAVSTAIAPTFHLINSARKSTISARRSAFVTSSVTLVLVAVSSELYRNGLSRPWVIGLRGRVDDANVA